MNQYICPICGNKDPRFIGVRNNHPYCRKCITFRGQEATDDYIQYDYAEYALSYKLSDDQKRLSDQLVENFKNGIDSLVHAVCGSGKTEIVLESIKYAIEHNLRVGFAVPRRDVARELFLRFKYIFKENKVVAVYGGCTSVLEADLVCITTHQLFRYEHYFDLLIIDEIDAFPYNGNDVLEAFFKRSLRGHYILLSATPPQSVIEEFKNENKMILRLDTRFHNHPLPVPQIEIHRGLMKYYQLSRVLRRFYAENKPVFVFTPTIDECKQLYQILKFLFKEVDYIHSKKSDRNETIERFRKGQSKILITTAVLERGVTIKNLQVVIFNAHHVLYTSAALIQISGRVGRKIDCPTGEVIFIASKQTMEMESAVREIERANKSLQVMLQGRKAK